MIRVLTFLMLLSVAPICGFSQNALNFDGVDDYVETDHAGVLGSSARTVEAWINTTVVSNPGDGGVQQIITDWGSFVTGGRFTFNLLGANAIRIEVGGSGLSGTIPVNDGAWHHVACVYDPSDLLNPYALYVDGVLDVEGDIPTDINTISGTDLRIGRRVDNARNFDGNIDEVRVWDIARTQDEIIADMNNEYCSIPADLVAYYKFNHGVAGGSNPGVVVLEDFSGGDHDGDLMSFALTGPTSNWVEGIDLPATIESEFFVATCLAYTVPSGDETHYLSGTYMDTLTSVFGCDSILTIEVELGYALGEMTEVACGSFTVPSGDETYTTTGVYMDTLPALGGCDSIITINLTVNYAGESSIEETACDEYEAPSGAMYTESGTYIDIIETEAGCDSTITIELEIVTFTTSSITVNACNMYEAPSGDDYTESGIITDIIENEAGCDSIITIDLTIHEDAEVTIDVTTCGSYTVPSGDATYDETGTYMDLLITEDGCDSVLTINLTIEDLDITVTNADPTLTAIATGVTYQWVDCDADFTPIDGATDQTFTPDDNGNYAVIISDGECIDTSDCYAIITAYILNNNLPSLSFYPNPTKGSITVELPEIEDSIVVNVISTDGKIVQSYTYSNAQKVDLNIDGAAGMYFVNVITEANQYVLKVNKD
ncbi:MAG: hypothetical protein ACI8ZM_001604 [Crocinitomix sp.]|jgi:hypothetical protein